MIGANGPAIVELVLAAGGGDHCRPECSWRTGWRTSRCRRRRHAPETSSPRQADQFDVGVDGRGDFDTAAAATSSTPCGGGTT